MHDDGQKSFVFLRYATHILRVCSVAVLEKQRFLSRPSTFEDTL